MTDVCTIQSRVISVHSYYLTSLVNLSFYGLEDLGVHDYVNMKWIFEMLRFGVLERHLLAMLKIRTLTFYGFALLKSGKRSKLSEKTWLTKGLSGTYIAKVDTVHWYHLL